MMPEHLLEELMNSATQHGVKTALIMAFEHGKLESYREFMQDVAKPPVDNSYAAANLDMHLQSRGGCYEPEA